MKALLVAAIKAHTSLLRASLKLASLRYRAVPGMKRPTGKQYDATIESAYWELSNAANSFLPYVSALETLVNGEGS